MHDCGENGNGIFPQFLVFEWLQADIIFEADECIKLIPPIAECYIAGQWDVSRDENDINIAKPSIRKAAVSGINEMVFPSFSYTYLPKYNLEFQGSIRNLQKRTLFMKFYPEMP